MNESKIDKISLETFIENNNKLISVLGVFTALTVFARSLLFGWVGHALSYIFLFMTIIIFTELITKFPKNSYLTQRLTLFKIALKLAIFGVSLYWFWAFKNFWVQLLPLFIYCTVFILVLYILSRFDIYNLPSKIFLQASKNVKKILNYLWIIFIFILLVKIFSYSTRLLPFVEKIVSSLFKSISKTIGIN